MKKILVMGANGYIGSHVVSELCKFNDVFDVIACDLYSDNITNEIPFLKHNIIEDDAVSFFERNNSFDAIIYLTWQDNFNHNSFSHLKNLYYHFNFLKSAVEFGGAKQLLVTGSFREYGKCNGQTNAAMRPVPDNYYALSKTSLFDALSIFIKNYEDVCFQWCRPFTVFGDEKLNGSLLGKIARWEREGKLKFPFTDGNEEYDYISVYELSRQIVAIINQCEINGIIDCCSGSPVKLRDVVEKYLKENHFNIKPEYGAYPSRSYDSKTIYGNPEKINNILQNSNLYGE